MPETTIQKRMEVADVFYEVKRVSGETEYHHVINPTVQEIDGVMTIVDGKDVVITKEEYEENR